MGGSSTQQAEANQSGNQAQAEQYYTNMINSLFGRIQGLPSAPVNKWKGIQGPGADMSRAWNPKPSPLAQKLSGWSGAGGGGQGGGNKGGGSS